MKLERINTILSFLQNSLFTKPFFISALLITSTLFLQAEDYSPENQSVFQEASFFTQQIQKLSEKIYTKTKAESFLIAPVASDDFSSGDGTGGTGWVGNWTFSNASVVSPSPGGFTTGSLIFMDGNSFGTADRTVDLSAYASATLTFNFECDDNSSGFESGDFVRVRVSTDGGSSFSDLWYRDGDQVCPNSNDSETYNPTVTLPVGNANTIIRLESGSNSSSEDIFWDNIMVDGVVAPQTCDCTDYIYLNEQGDNKIIKFKIETDGSLTVEADPFLEIDNPHGGVIGPNGNIWVSDFGTNFDTYLIDCEGDYVGPAFPDPGLDLSGFNFEVYNGVIYTQGASGRVEAFNMRTGMEIGYIDYVGSTTSYWGIHINQSTGDLYAGEYQENPSNIYIFPTDTALYAAETEFPGVPTPFITINDEIQGVTCDPDGNLYVANRTGNSVLKYNSSGTLLATFQGGAGGTPGGEGLIRPWGIIYLDGKLYTSNQSNSNTQDCITVIDAATMTSGGAGYPAPAGNSFGKNLYTIRECCPANLNQSVTEQICDPVVGDRVYLADMLPCADIGGNICGGSWTEVGSHTNVDFDPSDFSLEILSSSAGCSEYKYENTNASVGCGVFTINVMVCIECCTGGCACDLELSYTQANCVDNNDGTFTAAYDVTASWENPPSTGDITLTLTGDGSLNTTTIPESTIASGSTITISNAFTVPADGTGTTQIDAAFDDEGTCSASFNFKAPVPCPTDALMCTNTFTPTFQTGSYGEEDTSDGSVSTGSSDIELVEDGVVQEVGILFSNVTIPAGATVTGAFIQFQVDETGSGSTNLMINGEANATPANFSSFNGDVSNRSTTSASVNWAPNAWTNIGDAGADQQTPDLTSIVQEIIGLGGWNAGQDIAFIITGSGTRTAESNPTLTITYETVGTCSPSTICNSIAATSIKGVVWEDYNYNGGIDESVVSGVAGIQVLAYDCENTLVATTYSTASGTYEFAGLTIGEEYRIEFVLPENVSCWAKPTQAGADNGTTVQFVQPGNCASFGLINLANYCPADVNSNLLQPGKLVVSCAALDLDDPVLAVEDLRALGFSTSTQIPPIYMNADWTVENIGNIYFTETDNSGNIYAPASSFTRARFVTDPLWRYGTLGGGAESLDAAGTVYRMDAATGAPMVWAQLPQQSTLLVRGNDPNADTYAPARTTGPGLGGVAYNDKCDQIAIANMEDGKIYIFDASHAGPFPLTMSDAVSIYDPLSADNGAVGFAPFGERVFGLEFYEDRLYYVIHDFSSVFNTPLITVRSVDFSSCLNGASDNEEFSVEMVFGDDFNDGGAYPVSADIDISASGVMAIGAFSTMRKGYYGSEFGTPSNVGDLYNHKTGNYVFEESGGVWSRINYTTVGQELFAGVVPHGTSTGGVAWNEYDGATGNIADILWMSGGDLKNEDSKWGVVGYDIDDLGNSHTVQETASPFIQFLFDPLDQDPKGNGGDVDVYSCNFAPLEIGNYVWCDSIQNGIQDACERGINDILVSLYDRNGVLVGQDSTSNSGQYYFNQNNVDTTGITVDGNGISSPVTSWSGMSYATQYFIVFGGAGQFATDEFTVGGETYGITSMVNAGSNDNIDSDVDGSSLSTALNDMPAGLPFIDMTTSATGCGDHKYDMGVTCVACPEITELITTRLICHGENVDTLAALTTLANPDSIAFVYFATAQTDSSVIYTGGTGIDTVQISAASDTARITNVSGFTNTGSGTQQYFVYAIAHPTPTDNTCRPYEEIIVNVKGVPTVSVADVSICEGETATITAVVGNTGSKPTFYSWSVPGGAANPGSVTSFSTTTAGTYSVTVTNDGCSASDSGTLTVHPSPSITGIDTSFCGIQMINLASLINGSTVGTVEYGTSYGSYTTAIASDVTVSSTTTFYIRDSNETTMCVDTAAIIVTLLNCDWGDLPDISANTNPDDYQTSNANNGPVHVVIPGLSLGSTVDGEIDGQPSGNALGDGVDEDGFTLFTSLDLSPGSTFRLPFSYINTTGNTAHVEAWIDWNGDGAFDGMGEMVVDWNDGAGALPNNIEVMIPTTAQTGSFLGYRIRISNQDNMTPYGLQPNGEIEDYLIGIDCPNQICIPIQSTIIRKE